MYLDDWLEIVMEKKTRIKPQKLKGFVDVAPNEMRRKAQMMERIRQVAELRGFGILSTPTLEYSENLLGVGGETDKQVFRFRDNGDRDVCMRFDLTLPLARYIAENYGKIPLPAKCMQMGNVFRAEKPQKGRYREFTQCDLDIVGVDSLESDVEILLFVVQILSDLDAGEFVVRMGNRLVLNALQQKILPGLTAEQWHGVLIAVDKLDKIGAEAVAKMIAEENNLSFDSAHHFICQIKDGTGLEELASSEGGFNEEISRFIRTRDLVNQAAQRDVVVIDLSIARGLGYYTGMVFETNLVDLPSIGSVCSGGRYNGLVNRFLRDEVPCVGLSVGLSRLLAALDTGVEQQSIVPIYLFTVDQKNLGDALRLAQEIRSKGVGVDLSVKSRKLAQHFKFADKSGFQCVVHFNLDGQIKMKNLATGIEEVFTDSEKILRQIETHFC